MGAKLFLKKPINRNVEEKIEEKRENICFLFCLIAQHNLKDFFLHFAGRSQLTSIVHFIVEFQSEFWLK